MKFNLGWRSITFHFLWLCTENLVKFWPRYIAFGIVHQSYGKICDLLNKIVRIFNMSNNSNEKPEVDMSNYKIK